MEIEERFSIELENERLAHVRTVRELGAYVHSRLPGSVRDRGEVEALVVAIIREHQGLRHVPLDASFADLGID